jgi:Na+/H+ antiporter NhaD/arsenite permease-like protein
MNLLAAGLLLAVLVAVLVRQVAGRGPGVWLIFVVGGLLAVATGVLSIPGAARAIDSAAPVILFLLALFLFAGALARAGALDHLARWLVRRAARPGDLPAVLFVGFGLASAFLVNDALVLIGVPVLIALAARLRVGARPFLLVLAFAVTVGSVLTPFGNPQNLLVSIESGFPSPVFTFLRYLAVPTAINLGLGAWFLRRTFAKEMPTDQTDYDRLRADAPPLLPVGGWTARLRRFPVLGVFPGTMIVLITVDITAALTHGPAVPVWETAGAGAVVLMLVTPGRAAIVRGINWSILLLFAGLFVVVGAAEAGGVIGALESLLPIPGPGHPSTALLAIAGTSLAGSQVVSNVPWVALQLPVLAGLGYAAGNPVPWLALAGASTLAGNVTFLGAASNLIVVDLAERERVRVGLGAFVRAGLPLAAMTVSVLVVCLYFGL